MQTGSSAADGMVGGDPPLAFPLPLSSANLELLRWDLTLRAVQNPLCAASKALAKGMWPGDPAWDAKLAVVLKSELHFD